MAARKHPGPGSLPARGVAASVVVAVRLTPAEAAKWGKGGAWIRARLALADDLESYCREVGLMTPPSTLTHQSLSE